MSVPQTISPAAAQALKAERAKAERKTWVVARETFTTTYDGQPVTVKKDLTGMSADHEIARKHPEKFYGPCAGHQLPDTKAKAKAPAPPRAASTTPPAPAATPRADDQPDWYLAPDNAPPTVQLRDGRAQVEVVLSESARRTIYDVCKKTGETGQEIGGQLFGALESGRSEVRTAHGPGPNAVRRLSSFKADAAHDAAEAAAIRRAVGDFGEYREIGSYHTHPARYKNGQPSEGDMAAWAGMFTMFDSQRFTPRHVAFIVEPGRDGAYSDGEVFDPTRAWRSPDIHAWVIHRNRSGFGADLVCERATIV